MQVNASESQEANNFIKHLWSNPTLSGLSPLQKEEQLQQFLVINESKLFPTLNSTSFFPLMSWKQIRQSLQKSLSEHTNQVQTLAEDVLVIAGALWSACKFLLYTSFLFDFFFTVEFLIRSWIHLSRRRFGHYFLSNNGWVDFLASVPLLVFSSGSVILSMFSGSVFIISVTLISAAFTVLDYNEMEKNWENQKISLLQSLTEKKSDMQWKLLHPSLIRVKEDGQVVYSQFDDDYLKRYLGSADYSMEQYQNMSLWFALRAFSAEDSRLNLSIFFITLFVVLVLIVTYTPHFAVTISDPVNIMAQGFWQQSYNLEVRIPHKYSTDDLFRLAKAFNNEYLPLKERNNANSPDTSVDISLDDIGDLIN